MTETTLPAPPPPSPRERKKPRSLFWPGFVIGFALLSLAGCGGLAMAMGLTDLSLAEFQGVGAAWTPPTIPTAEPISAEVAAVSAEVVSDGTFRAGDSVRNVTAGKVNVRMTPGHLGKPVGDIISQIDSGATLEIIGERASQDNLLWWHVRVNGLEGWVAEATASGVQILAK